jgi:hypothetical protein
MSSQPHPIVSGCSINALAGRSAAATDLLGTTELAREAAMSVSGISSSFPYNPLASRMRSADETVPKERAYRVDVGNLISLNLKPSLSPVPADFMQKLLEAQFTRPVGEPDDAPGQLYAEIKVGNKTIGKVYNSGCCETPNSFAGRVEFGGPDEDGLTGPELAQHRAEKIAKACGGIIVTNETAVTQAEFDARPPRQFYVDYEAMNAEIERLRQSAEQRSGHYRATPANPASSPNADVAV